MAYASGTNTGSTDPISDIIGEVETLLTAHAAWSFVEEVIDGSWTYRIWKNSGLQNGWGEDFYFAFLNSSSTNLYVIVFEDWNPVTKKGVRGIINPGVSLTPESTYGSRYGDDEDDLDNSNAFSRSGRIYLSTVTYDWWVVVSNNFVMVMTSETWTPAYLGVFETFHPTNPREFPLLLLMLGDTDDDGAGSFSRIPEWSGSRTDCFAARNRPGSATNWTILDGEIPSGELLHGGEALGSRFAVSQTNSNDGHVRGLAYDLLIFNTNGAVSKGDTITVDGNTYWYTYNDIWINRDAA